MGITRWLKIWGALLIAVIALGLSGYAVHVDNVHYQEIIKPHTQHDEIYNRLVRLDDKIERVQQWIGVSQDLGQDTSESQINLRSAMELRDQAELAWDEDRYTEADKLISEAHHILEEIPLLAAPFSFWLWIIIGLGSAAVGFAVWMMVSRRRT